MPIVKGKKIFGNPKVSAVIAAYNEELHLGACVESLLKQSYKNFEIIIVENGGSKDKTLEIAKRYEKEYKNVRAFSLPGKQKGPGNAWGFGTKMARGKIIMICGADLRYGKDYVKNGIKRIMNGETVGLVHKEEICNNTKNLWARAFFYRRLSADTNGLSHVFSLVRRDYLIKRPYNSELGYADDQTIYMAEGSEFPVEELEIYHTNPASLSDTWDHSKWVGKSIKNKKIVVAILPLFPLYAIYKSLKHLIKEDFYVPFILFLPIYYSVRYFAYLSVAVRYLFIQKKIL